MSNAAEASAPPAGQRVGDKLPSRAGEVSREGTLLGGADRACAPGRPSAEGSRPSAGTGAEDRKSRRWIVSAAALAAEERGDTLLLVGERRLPSALTGTAATAAAAAARVEAPGAEVEGHSGVPKGVSRGSIIRQASERGRSMPLLPCSALLPVALPLDSSADPLLLGGSGRPPLGCGMGGRLGGSEGLAATAAIAASSPGLATRRWSSWLSATS